MEKVVWEIHWIDTEGKKEVKISDNEIETYNGESGVGIVALIKYVLGKYGKFAWENVIYLKKMYQLSKKYIIKFF